MLDFCPRSCVSGVRISNVSNGEQASGATGSVAEAREEVQRVIQSPSFKSSRRSQQFLNHIAEKALTGSSSELKERLIGAALFGRAVDYDTGSDSIVRVVANETRRRLAQFYAEDRASSGIKIELPVGTYIPSVLSVAQSEPPVGKTPQPAAPVPQWREQIDRRRSKGAIWALALCAFLGIICAALAIDDARLRKRAEPERPALRTLPWSALLDSGRKTRIILADTSIGGIQNVLQSKLPLVDYLNRNYIPEGKYLSDQRKLLDFLSTSQYTSASYASVAVTISNFALANATPVAVSYARDISMRTVEGGENLILLGTARANPWVQLFENRLNFRFQFFNGGHEPRFRNEDPRPGEAKEYVPRSEGSATRVSYGHVAFLPSSYGSGSVLLIAGTTSLATEGAAELVTNLPRLQEELAKLGLEHGAAPRGFELLTEVSHMANTPTESKVLVRRLSPE